MPASRGSRACERRQRASTPVFEGLRRKREQQVDECRQVPVAPFRERFEELRQMNLMTMGQLCQHMGWTYVERNRSGRHHRDRKRPDTTTGRRRLGLAKHYSCVQPTETVDYEIAVRLCRVLGLDPHEAGV